MKVLVTVKYEKSMKIEIPKEVNDKSVYQSILKNKEKLFNLKDWRHDFDYEI